MKTVAEVIKNNNEPAVSLLRRFSKRVRSSNVLQKVRANRYFSRVGSKTKQKARALNNIERKAEFKKLEKLGKAPVK